MGASMTITGVDSASRRLRDLGRRAANPDMSEVADVFEEHVSKTFDTQGANIGLRWRPLTASWKRRKSALGGGRPLVLSGGLSRSFESGEDHIKRLEPRRLVWGSKHPLAHLHHRGTPGGLIPERQILRVTPELRRQVKETLRRQILDNR